MNESAPIKVAICVPSGDEVKTDFAMSLINMLQCTKLVCDGDEFEFVMHVYNVKGSILPANRNYLVEMALKTESKYVFFVDSDMRFPYYTLAHLAAAAEINKIDIIGCTASSRAEGNIHRDNVLAFKDGGWLEVNSMNTDGIHEVQRVGTGVLLIATSMFQKLEKPWFQFNWNEKLQQFDGEDHSFCDLARAAGFKIYVDFTLSKQIGHIGQFTYTVNEDDDVSRMRSRKIRQTAGELERRYNARGA